MYTKGTIVTSFSTKLWTQKFLIINIKCLYVKRFQWKFCQGSLKINWKSRSY